MKISKAGNMTGWSFKVWVVKNKDNLKLILSGISGILTTLLSGLSTPYGVALGGLVAAVSKMLFDSIDFYVTDVKIA